MYKLKYIIPLFLIITALKGQENNNLRWLEYDPIFRYFANDSNFIHHEIIEHELSGLKNDSLNNFQILVEVVAENSLGITDKYLEDITTMALFANGIKPMEDNTNYLYIKFTTIGSAFNLGIHFKRSTFSIINRKKYRFYGAVTWSKAFTGTHGQNKMFITDSLRELIDKFSIAYIKANK